MEPGSFESHHHWYPKALNANIHPLVRYFMGLSTHRIVQRYTHLHPSVEATHLQELLSYSPKYFKWAGADLFHVTDNAGRRRMIVIENNSCPSGQKSMPLYNDDEEQGGYRRLMEATVPPSLRKKLREDQHVAVLYDKNPMETKGYASALADLLDRDIILLYWPSGDNSLTRYDNGVLEILHEGSWKKIAMAFRYVTQKPWNRIPVNTKTKIVNPVLTCLAGGRNKLMASKAYEFFNARYSHTGLAIRTPQTIRDVSLGEVPIWVERMGGMAVVKSPYGNAGQAVYTIVSQEELDKFLAIDHAYDKFIVQALIGDSAWSSLQGEEQLYHVGTVPNLKGNTYAADLRIMVSGSGSGFQPLCMYSRRARKPLVRELKSGEDSWSRLGTNLSIKREDGGWDSDTDRLLLMDRRDFNALGVGLDDLIEGYIQTVLSTIAIDQLAIELVNSKGRFRAKLFRSMDADKSLISEILLD